MTKTITETRAHETANRRLTTQRTLVRPIHTSTQADTVDDHVRRRLSRCPYRYYFKDVTWEYNDGFLVLRGRVPSFWLRHTIEAFLQDMDGVAFLRNDIDVVSATGLSSTHAS